MKVLVLGATGMAGHVIANYLVESGHEVTCFSRQPLPGFHGHQGDATDPAALRAALFESDFDAVVNGIGILNRDAEENRALAIMLNSWLPHYLSDLHIQGGPRVVHISTDCVFSGTQGGYSETSSPDSLTFYGRSKALGELDNDRDLTFRTSIIGPDMRANGIGLLNWFMQQDGKVPGYARAIWTGVSTITLARAIEHSLKEQLTGLHHLVNGQPISKLDLLSLFNKNLRSNSVVIVPSQELVVNKSLINQTSSLAFEVPGYDAMVAEIADWIVTHDSIYPHYAQAIPHMSTRTR
jgi:dTDP-4-dehydrorhamnose reductase